MVKKMFPEMAENISVAMTPMVLTARFVKKTHPGCKVVFVGPCDAKKLEASRRTVRSDVDFVLTFEEVLGMFAAKDIDKEFISAEEAQPLSQARRGRAKIRRFRRRCAGGRQCHQIDRPDA